MYFAATKATKNIPQYKSDTVKQDKTNILEALFINIQTMDHQWSCLDMGGG